MSKRKHPEDQEDEQQEKKSAPSIASIAPQPTEILTPSTSDDDSVSTKSISDLTDSDSDDYFTTETLPNFTKLKKALTEKPELAEPSSLIDLAGEAHENTDAP